MIEITVTPQQGRALDCFFEGKTLTDTALVLAVSYSRVINILNAILVKTKLSSRKELLLNKDNIHYEIQDNNTPETQE